MMNNFWKRDNVSLRIINKSDVESILKSFKDIKFRMNSDHGISLPGNINKAEDIVNDAIISSNEEDEIYFSIINNEGVMVGYTVLGWFDERHGTTDCNINIFTEFRNNGYGTSAYSIMLDYIFNERRMHKVNCCTIDGNEEGPKFLYKFGFKFEAKRSEMFYSHGKYLAEYYFGLTKGDYISNKEYNDYPDDYLSKVPYSSLGEIKKEKNPLIKCESEYSRKYFWEYEDIIVRATELNDYYYSEEIVKDPMVSRRYDNEVKLPVNVDDEYLEQKYSSHFNFKSEDNRLEFAITDNKGQFVGSASLDGIDYKNGKFSLSIFTVPEMRGKGYGTKSVRLILSYAFFELRLNKFIGVVNDDNPSSAAIMRKIGAEVEGVKREGHFYLGKYSDEVFFGINKKEFAAANRQFGVVPE